MRKAWLSANPPWHNASMKRGVRIGLALGISILLGTATIAWHSRPSARGPVVTAAEFQRIVSGMTYDECVAIIGSPGTPYGATGPSTEPSESTEWVSYLWTNSRDSSAEISFFRGGVESKREHALP